MKVMGTSLLHGRVRLKYPYNLSFARIDYVDSLVVQMQLENNWVGFGEAVPLPGYSDETCESLISDIGNVASKMIGLDCEKITEYVSNALPNSPFARSSLCVAKEMALGQIDLDSMIDHIPLVAPIASSMNAEEVLIKANELIDSGYKTLKLKVGRDIESDVITVKTLLSKLGRDIKLRIDANQAYSETDARRLLGLIIDSDSAIVEVVEQPFGVNDWDRFASLVRDYPQVPLMLDESIFDVGDLERAESIGTKFIKLKLFKHRGISELIELATKANEIGMGVVLGNGVSTDIGNLIEASLYSTGLFMGGLKEMVMRS